MNTDEGSSTVGTFSRQLSSFSRVTESQVDLKKALVEKHCCHLVELLIEHSTERSETCSEELCGRIGATDRTPQIQDGQGQNRNYINISHGKKEKILKATTAGFWDNQ